MKANLRQKTRRLQRWKTVPVMEQVQQGLVALAAGFLLAGFQVADTILPLPICLAASLGLCTASFGAYVGGCLGYLVFSPFHALEPMAAGLLVQAALCLFGDDLPRYDRWFIVGCSTAFTALVGFLFLLEQRFAAQLVFRYILRVLVAGAGTYCFRIALQEKTSVCRLVLIGCLCAGACAIRPVGLPLGAVAACVLAAAAVMSSDAVLVAAICGLALDLTWAPGCVTGALVLSSLLCRSGNRVVRTLCWLVSTGLGVLLLGTHGLFLAAAFFGAVGALFVPADKLFPKQLPAVGGADPRLGAATGLLYQLGRRLAPVPRDKPDPEMAAVFDQAADRVCRVCGGWDKCWNEQVHETVGELEQAAPAMLARGRAHRRDLPESFIARCCHVEGFLTAVNRELDDLSCRRQCRSRVAETRTIVSEQYAVLAKALAQPWIDGTAPCKFRPEVGFRSEEAPEQRISGDRGVTFRVGKYFYLILCDGMGTGAEAEEEAVAAIGILRTLLQAQVEPRQAMELLNGIYVLRDDGGFATVDLVQADLQTGEVHLMKWGAAPSYLKRKNSVEKLGTASLPPGIGFGEDFRPEEITVSLARGEMLVLLSDGASTEAAERCLRQYTGSFPKEVAYGVIHAQPKAEDDRTAAVFMLRSRIPK